jgi:hypothetical protein
MHGRNDFDNGQIFGCVFSRNVLRHDAGRLAALQAELCALGQFRAAFAAGQRGGLGRNSTGGRLHRLPASEAELSIRRETSGALATDHGLLFRIWKSYKKCQQILAQSLGGIYAVFKWCVILNFFATWRISLWELSGQWPLLWSEDENLYREEREETPRSSRRISR